MHFARVPFALFRATGLLLKRATRVLADIEGEWPGRDFRRRARMR